LPRLDTANPLYHRARECSLPHDPTGNRRCLPFSQRPSELVRERVMSPFPFFSNQGPRTFPFSREISPHTIVQFQPAIKPLGLSLLAHPLSIAHKSSSDLSSRRNNSMRKPHSAGKLFHRAQQPKNDAPSTLRLSHRPPTPVFPSCAPFFLFPIASKSSRHPAICKMRPHPPTHPKFTHPESLFSQMNNASALSLFLAHRAAAFW